MSGVREISITGKNIAIIEDADDIALVKAIASGAHAEAVVKLVCSSQQYKSAVTSVLREICNSTQVLAGHLVQRTPESLLTFSFTDQWQSLQPRFVNVLQHLAKRHVGCLLPASTQPKSLIAASHRRVDAGSRGCYERRV